MPPDVTTLLHRWADGDAEALDQLMPQVYDELKRLAHGRLRRDRPDHTLNTTALVHEAYLKLVKAEGVAFAGRSHFMAVAARAMRQILIDYAIRRRALKRGGGRHRVELDEERLLPDDQAESLLELDDALQRLEATHPRPGQAIALRYFGGMTLQEIATALDTSPATAMRDVRFGQAWLARHWQGDLNF